MYKFYVINWNFNDKEPELLNVIKPLVEEYKEKYKNLKLLDEENMKEFILNYSSYHWWSKCEYEIVIKRWPPSEEEHKIDVAYQVAMNLDVITDVLKKELLYLKKLKRNDRKR